MRLVQLVLFVVLALALTPVSARSQAGPVAGTWRIVRGVAAPWVAAGSRPAPPRAWVGRAVTFGATQVRGPGALHCSAATYTPTRMPAEGLFQGGLPSPAVEAARSVGFSDSIVSGTSLTCDTGIFELHAPDSVTLLVALDNVIWTLDRSLGASAPAGSPSGVVQRFLEAHFAGDMGFSRANVATRRRWLSGPLAARIARYFAAPRPADEAPPIDGDPFTDSQEYPTRFSVGAARVSGATADVPVRFRDGYVARTVVYRLRREGGTWRVDDLRYEDGSTFRGILS